MQFPDLKGGLLQTHTRKKELIRDGYIVLYEKDFSQNKGDIGGNYAQTLSWKSKIYH